MTFNTDIVIGLEIHVELNTDTKLFCGCPTSADKPNSSTCDVCLGFPGTKPVLNKKAVDYAIRLCLALGCKISPQLVFSRKSYFYPDMAKNYQITQYELPLGKNGKLNLSDGKTIGITRVHMEEDPASLVHPAGMTDSQFVLVDYNRSGRPLCEVVTEPDMDSPEQARDFMKQLINVLRYLKIFDINNCVIKADANISIKESGYVKVEVKNITGFKEIEKALNYEIERQKQAVLNNEKIVQETRAWDADSGITISMRKKETEEDYGYILDPDLVVTDITKDWIKKVKDSLPELHQERAKRYVNKYKISKENAKVLTLDYDLSEFFDAVAKRVNPVLAAKWVRRELPRVLNYNKLEFSDIKFGPKEFGDILKLLSKNKITDNVAKKILEKLCDKPFDVEEYVKKQGLQAVSGSGALEKIVKNIVKENLHAVAEYKDGKEQSLNFLVGKVMRKTRGAAQAGEVIKLIKKIIE
ncbi:Asp-tRNA(Asn)/Glu-tRNA(Gln) amidotransferase subunit GatB [Candidatus Woesearchaeota archaeon]|nr:Asp-tRNA(Asn)/Glu-tRNA(Gln) amidotransferase subunit GatB [Candidatus Woesearchaeota archaeon]